MNNHFLAIDRISKSFGGLMALVEVSFSVTPLQIKAIIGPNGSGKTTLFNIMTGFLSPSSGSIIYKGNPIVGKNPHQIAMLGITRTFQTARVFNNMTVLENVMVGRHIRTRSELVKGSLAWPASLREEKEILIKAEEIVHFIGLDGRKKELADNLSFAERRRLEIGRCLACEPEMILMDEPAGGLNDVEMGELAQMIFKIRGGDISVLLVEHHMRLVMEISDEVLVLNHGVKIAEGTPAKIRSDEQVIDAYLGRKSLRYA